jgi:heat shock protein HslJ
MRMPAAGLCLAAMVALGAIVPAQAGNYACSGTEPFWSMTLGGKASTFEAPDGKQKLRIIGTRAGQNVSRDYVEVFSARLGSKGRAVTIVVRGDSCSDGMSDTGFSHSATVLMPDGVYVGCCNKK